MLRVDLCRNIHLLLEHLLPTHVIHRTEGYLTLLLDHVDEESLQVGIHDVPHLLFIQLPLDLTIDELEELIIDLNGVETE